MNSAQKLDAMMERAENAAAYLINHARNYDGTKPWETRDILIHARRYADAMRAIRNAHRNERRRNRKGATP